MLVYLSQSPSPNCVFLPYKVFCLDWTISCFILPGPPLQPGLLPGPAEAGHRPHGDSLHHGQCGCSEHHLYYCPVQCFPFLWTFPWLGFCLRGAERREITNQHFAFISFLFSRHLHLNRLVLDKIRKTVLLCNVFRYWTTGWRHVFSCEVFPAYLNIPSSLAVVRWAVRGEMRYWIPGYFGILQISVYLFSRY